MDGEKEKKTDRKLGDEWLDWDGTAGTESTEADYRVFLGLAVLSTVLLIVIAGLFLWLIYPRLSALGTFLPRLFSLIFIIFGAILFLWLLLFVWSAVTRSPITRLIAIPKLVNRLLSLVTMLGKILGVSRDRLTNSFLKIHNMILGSRPSRTEPERLLLLLPRCLTKETNHRLRELRDKYQFKMATVGGGSEARLKIRESRPKMVIAIACERDLISGFKEINPYIPVIGFPNRRPEGPCKNTCVDPDLIERAIRNHILDSPGN
ncbi:conserved hypothetical protein [Candidatus Zixiibacteriota bacterium]|nr:conserved hypothetical protein [candidate division Zixibacteria bacterium]